ncbi:MAG TPA: DUF6677 family protein [Pyrinomonadaceae bacterium]|nr:DUF6677 family protein [Pyrinomonadaceae bacterium]
MANRIEKTRDIETPRRAWLVGLVAWAVPGAGHLLERRWLRAALLGGAVWIMFLMGLWLGGHLFTVTGKEEGFGVLLQLLPMVGNIGTGLLYIICWMANIGFAEKAQLVTYEYGNTFLLVAGLLNYLAMLDAFDIAAGRKP